ncbi:hypothetical protein [Streptomyces scabiei]|uniref:hypothetical protein n=1 Tax=Streptomyces scabiei TaxID=1930 RepID=UPI0029B23253|nr:hypothetical protein [Streptomyces scabiei]MDX3112576.1 hypothetical protein [Streptomyces scabiei]
MTADSRDAGTHLTTRRSHDAVAERHVREIGDELDGRPLEHPSRRAYPLTRGPA